MAIISAEELKNRTGQSLDERAIAQARPGGTKGVMRGHFMPQGEIVQQQAGKGKQGASVYASGELPQAGFFGSSTVISVNDSPPLDKGLEPKSVPIPEPDASATEQAGRLSAADILRKFGMAPPI
jgi:hypothetical protein